MIVFPVAFLEVMVIAAAVPGAGNPMRARLVLHQVAAAPDVLAVDVFPVARRPDVAGRHDRDGLVARRRRQSHAMPMSSSLDGMATKPQSKARTVSCVSWSEGGWAHSMANLPVIFGTPNFEAHSASIRRLPAPFCR